MKSDIKLRFTPGLLVLVLSLVLLVVGAYLGFQLSSTAHPDGKESLWIILLIIGTFLGVIGLRTRRDEIRDLQEKPKQIRSSEDQKAIHGFFSFALGIMLFSIFYSILQDVRCQKVWYLSRQAELGVYQEIITRIHAQPNFNPTKKYKLVLLGRVNTRKYFDKRNDAGNKWDDFRRTFIHGAHPQTFFNFMEQRNYITVFIHDYHSDEWISSLDKNYILSKAKPWPHRESVAIIKDTIYIILEQKKLEQVQKRLNELTTKRTP